jgi:hypothetical protein
VSSGRHHHRRPAGREEDDDEDDGIKPLPERLVIELTAHRTLALRDAWRTIRMSP